jgi:hypothetical protein
MRDAAALEAFRRHVILDDELVEGLRPIADTDAFVRAVVDVGAAHGFLFEAADVAEALRAGQRAWLGHWLPVL